jgi:hypothetical protein
MAAVKGREDMELIEAIEATRSRLSHFDIAAPVVEQIKTVKSNPNARRAKDLRKSV